VKEDDDATLVQRCREGDRTAFDRLVVRYQRPVYNAALRLLRDPEEARDVTQTTFLKVFEHLRDYDPSFRFYSWLYRIAVNESLDALGARRSRGESEDDKADESPGPEQQLEGDQMSRAIDEALTHIKPELRSVIVLRHFLHLSYQDMGEVLRLPEKTVKSRLYSARQLLRDQLVRRGVI
jgi:RNA polymerase sigma-70 factor (ECF subfamily)